MKKGVSQKSLRRIGISPTKIISPPSKNNHLKQGQKGSHIHRIPTKQRMMAPKRKGDQTSRTKKSNTTRSLKEKR